MLQMSQVLRECSIGMLTAGMSTRAVTKEFNVNFSTISCLQHCFREFVSTSNQPHICRPCVWCRVGGQFADVSVVNRVSHGGGGVTVWVGINYGQRIHNIILSMANWMHRNTMTRSWGPFFLRYLWPTDAYLYSPSCEIHRLGPISFISIGLLPYMNCNSVKFLNLLHVVFILFNVDLTPAPALPPPGTRRRQDPQHYALKPPSLRTPAYPLSPA